MKNLLSSRFRPLVLAGVLLAAGGTPCQAQQPKNKAQDLAEVKPEAEGFSSDRLQQLHAAMQQKVDNHQLAGIVTVMARHGKIVDFQAYGKQDIAAGTPMDKDTIFRIYSMTKPVTSVAMMILYEQGKWNPSDPISKYIPEFAHLEVFKSVDVDGKVVLEDPLHQPTMGELMTHTAGFTYGLFGRSPVDKLYVSQRVMQKNLLQEMIDTLATTQLLYQPGTRWVYSVSVDIQGYIVEKLSGKTLPEFMQEHIFQPLKMNDTGFSVPQEKMSRFVTLYVVNGKGELTASSGGAVAQDYSKTPTAPSGGGGLTSTAHDYLRFAQILLSGGELDGVRILSPSSVMLMSANHLASGLMDGEFGIGFYYMKPGFGYGYDVAVFSDPVEAGSTTGKGTFLWDGVAGTWFWVDPTNDVVFVGMIQRSLLASGMPNMEELSRATVYQALVHPEK